MLNELLRNEEGKEHPCRSITELAKRIGVARTTLYYWEAHPGSIPLGAIWCIGKVLELPREEITKFFCPDRPDNET